MARPSSARFTPQRRSTGSGLHAAAKRNVDLGVLTDLGAHVVAELHRDLAVARLVPALAGHVELELERRLGRRRSRSRCGPRLRAPGSRRRRCRASASGSARPRPGGRCAILAGPVLRWRDLRPAGIEDPILDLGAHETLVSGQLGSREHLLHRDCSPPRLGSPQATGAGDAARRQVQLLELLPGAGLPARLSRACRSATGAASRRRASRRTRPAART